MGGISTIWHECVVGVEVKKVKGEDLDGSDTSHAIEIGSREHLSLGLSFIPDVCS